MDGITRIQLVFFIFLNVRNVFSYDGIVSLSHNGPVILGANITFTAVLSDLHGQKPSGTFDYDWRDFANPHHLLSISGTPNTTMNWTISFPSNEYPAQEYTMEVTVSAKHYFFYTPYAKQSLNFNVTEILNGRIDIEQEDVKDANRFVSIASPVKHTIILSEPDHNFLKKYATSVLTFWFVDCTYYGFSTDFTFTFNYTKDKSYSVEALIVASYDEPTTTTTSTTTSTTTTTTTSTTTTTTTPTTTPTTTTTPATPAPTVAAMKLTSVSTPSLASPSSPIAPETSSQNTSVNSSVVVEDNPPVSSSIPTQNDKLSDAADISGMLSAGEIHLKKRHVSNTENFLHNDILDNILSYGCLNSTFVPPSPNKTYGYFRKKIQARTPISKVVVKGNNWLKFGDVLRLNVTCNGSPKFQHCSKIKVGSYNVTGEETCSAPLEGDECNFTLPHYFREANVYTYVIIVMNDVSKVITPAVITMYKESIQPQLSVIVVPVSCSLVAIIIIVFGVAYYVQSQNRYSVEVADFDFGQVNDMEYKSFYGRLREDISNMFSRSGDFLDHNDAVPRRSKYDNMEES